MPSKLPDVTGMSNADAAGTYARHGFHITPVRPGTKAPYLRRWPERATCDFDTVTEHWRNHPDDGIAIHVGGSGLLVIDVDRPGVVAEWLWPLLEQAVFRPTTTDPNGRRGHYFYRLRPGEKFGCGQGGLKPPSGEAAGFDVKCDGGAIVVGPTYHPRTDEGGRYATGPAAMIPLRPDEIAAKLSSAAVNGEPVHHGHEYFSRSCLANRVRNAPEGRRNNTLFGAAKDAARQGDLDGEMIAELTSAALECGLGASEIDTTIHSAGRCEPEPACNQWLVENWAPKIAGPANEDAERERRIARRVRDLEERDEAQRRYAARLWVPPSYPKSLFDQLAEGAPEIDYIMEDLWSGVLQVNAQKKSGKTTLMINAARSLVMREPFLGRFAVNVQRDCRVAYLNMELARGQFNNWLLEMDVPDDAQKRIVPYHGRESGRLDFGNDRAVEWLIRWLRDEGVSIAFLDPLVSFYDQPNGGDPNAAYLRWWAVLEDVVLQANLRGVWIGHHSGISEDAANRARGASAMMDKPDVNVSYRYNVGEGAYTDAPVDSRRYLRAFGRDVDIQEFELGYHAPTRILHATGRGSRPDAEAERQAERMRDVVLRATAAGEQPNKTKLFDDLSWTNTGRGAKECNRWYKHAIYERRYVKTVPGQGREVLHVPGEGEPEWRVKLEREPEAGEELT